MIAQYLVALVRRCFMSREEREWRETVAAARSMAHNLAMLGGPDLRHMSDAELVHHLTEASRNMADVMRAASVTAQEAADAMSALGRAMRETQEQQEHEERA